MKRIRLERRESVNGVYCGPYLEYKILIYNSEEKLIDIESFTTLEHAQIRFRAMRGDTKDKIVLLDEAFID